MIPVTLLASPYRYPAVISPVTVKSLPTETFPVVTRPVVAFVKRIVFDEMFDVLKISSRPYDATIETCPRVSELIAAFPEMTSTLDPSSSMYRFEPTLKSWSGSVFEIPTFPSKYISLVPVHCPPPEAPPDSAAHTGTPPAETLRTCPAVVPISSFPSVSVPVP